jgi:ribosomal protein S18 acetylase RimI-like enzyme
VADDLVIRGYRDSDLASAYDVCVRTGDGGEDASGSYADPDVLPTVFLGPYVTLEPELAFVVDNGNRVVGYVVGTADTAEFTRRYAAEWLPKVGDAYPAPAGEPAGGDELMAMLLHWPERMLRPELADYPAHLHIDLLPEYQRMGLGRRLIDALCAALRARGVRGLHLEMLTSNTSARAFYDRLGFTELPADTTDTTILGLRLD